MDEDFANESRQQMTTITVGTVVQHGATSRPF